MPNVLLEAPALSQALSASLKITICIAINVLFNITLINIKLNKNKINLIGRLFNFNYFNFCLSLNLKFFIITLLWIFTLRKLNIY